jgi:hypothetical protein
VAVALAVVAVVPLAGSASVKVPRCAGLEIMVRGKPRVVIPTTCLY